MLPAVEPRLLGLKKRGPRTQTRDWSSAASQTQSLPSQSSRSRGGRCSNTRGGAVPCTVFFSFSVFDSVRSKTLGSKREKEAEAPLQGPWMWASRQDVATAWTQVQRAGGWLWRQCEGRTLQDQDQPLGIELELQGHGTPGLSERVGTSVPCGFLDLSLGVLSLG